ncbi:MAG: L,D-transpeptidase family protein [Alphaproteobacteria bacterium]|nr:L,D-transpeptidase family protein [Alphaproteobacteria bacterium]
MRLITLILLAAFAATTADAATQKASLIVVEKAKRIMTLYAGKKTIKTYRIALGGNPTGHKEQEGDSRTPEGRYTIDAKNPWSAFHLSMRVSYPDRKDRASASRRGVPPGGAIMIHGTPDGLVGADGSIPDWTLGCIAVTNKEVEEIYAMIRPGTPILIKP